MSELPVLSYRHMPPRAITVFVICEVMIGLFISLAAMVAIQGAGTFLGNNVTLERPFMKPRVRWKHRAMPALLLSILALVLHIAFAIFVAYAAPLGLFFYLT